MLYLTTPRLATLIPLALFLASVASESTAQKPVDDANCHRRSFMLKIDALHTLSGDVLHQEVIIEEGRPFFVSTHIGKIRWTFSGRVGHAVNGKLPLMMKSRWYETENSQETAITPRLLDINGKAGRFVASIHGHGAALTVRETTEADELPASEVMESELRRMIQELQESQVESRNSSK